MASRKGDSIVSAYLEHVSGALLARYPKVIRALIHGRSGIYALYKGDKIYYIGLAVNLRSRVKMHLRDRHTRKWDHFSVYLTTTSAHIKPLESLMLRVAMPSGNRGKGGLPRAANIYPTIVKMIRDEDADALARLMGGNVARRRRKAKTRKARGTVPLAGLVERRMALRAVYKGKTYRATLRKDGQIGYGGRLYESPAAATKVILGRPGNGWNFWHFRKGRSVWVRLRELKH
jgi:hypothetical protein